MTDFDKEFQGIANTIINQDGVEFLQSRLQATRNWIAYRKANGEETGLRDLSYKLMAESENRFVVVTMLACAIWRLLEIEEGEGNGPQ